MEMLGELPEDRRPKQPTFPEATALDVVLYEYLRRADRMGWSPYDLVDHEQVRSIARPERLSEGQVAAVKTVPATAAGARPRSSQRSAAARRGSTLQSVRCSRPAALRDADTLTCGISCSPCRYMSDWIVQGRSAASWWTWYMSKTW